MKPRRIADRTNASRRLLVRQGKLARTARADPDGESDLREPEELFEPDKDYDPSAERTD